MKVISEFSLPQNFRKEQPKHPDFVDKIPISGTPYQIAAWLKAIKRGPNTGSPCLSIQLRNEEDTDDKTDVSIWQNQNRKQHSDAHFRVDKNFRGQQCTFSAWLTESGGFFELKISITPLSSELSAEALSTQKRIKDFLKAAVAQEAETSPSSIAGVDDAPDEEQDDIPY